MAAPSKKIFAFTRPQMEKNYDAVLGFHPCQSFLYGYYKFQKKMSVLKYFAINI